MKTTATLLWVDLTLGKSTPKTSKNFLDIFSVKFLHTPPEKKTITSLQPDAIAFDYDFPDRAGLHLLLETKNMYPSLPVIMITEQHSEELVLWALHARVLEYLIKPTKSQQLIDLNNELLKIRTLRKTSALERNLLQRDIHTPHDSRISPENRSDEIIQRSTNYINSHLSEKICEAKLAKLSGMSPYRFSRLFKQSCSCTFQEYLLKRRIDEALRLLANPNSSITDIAFSVGFNDASYFTRAFKRFIGVSPSEFRNSQKNLQIED